MAGFRPVDARYRRGSLCYTNGCGVAVVARIGRLFSVSSLEAFSFGFKKSQTPALVESDFVLTLESRERISWRSNPATRFMYLNFKT
jgi:hypothetical protein